MLMDFAYIAKVLYVKENGKTLLCISENVTVDGHSLAEIIIEEAHSLLAHLGSAKTLTAVLPARRVNQIIRSRMDF